MSYPCRSLLLCVFCVGVGGGCVGSITDYDTIEITARRASFADGTDRVDFAFVAANDACIATPDLEVDIDDDVSDDVDGGGGNPCRPPHGSLSGALSAGVHRLTIDEGERDIAVRFTLPQRAVFVDGVTIVQGRTVVLRSAVHRVPDRVVATLAFAGTAPLELSPVIEGDDVRLPIPDDLVTGDPQDAALQVTITYRSEPIDDIDDIDDGDLDIVDDIGVAVTVRKANLLDDLIDIILGG